MAGDDVRSNTSSAETSHRFQMACLTLPTHLLQSFLQTQGAPRPQLPPTTVNVKALETDLSEVAKDLEEGVVVEKQG